MVIVGDAVYAVTVLAVSPTQSGCLCSPTTGQMATNCIDTPQAAASIGSNFEGRAAPEDDGTQSDVSDGTHAGTEQRLDSDPGEASDSNITVNQLVGQEHWRISVKNNDINQIYRSDGTIAGTHRLIDPTVGSVDIGAGMSESNVARFSLGENKSQGLGVSVGDPHEVVRVCRVDQRTASFQLRAFVDTVGEPFVVVDSSAGVEMSALDTESSASIVFDVGPGLNGSIAERFGRTGDVRYLSTADSTCAREI
ncbi:MAG: hypothetical protein ACJAXA_003633 [Candidatus Aldehydirespiratoraceae bacterium]